MNFQSTTVVLVVAAGVWFHWAGMALAGGAKVKFDKVWGTVTLLEGRGEERLKCVASEADPAGEFVWLVNGDVRANGSPVERTGDDEYEQELAVKPTLDLEGATLECRYVQRDPAGGEPLYESGAIVDVEIVVQDLPGSPYRAGSFREGERALLKVPIGLYPRPERGDLKWVVRDGAGNLFHILPGESEDAMPRYEALPLEDRGGDEYAMALAIGSVSEQDARNDVYLLVNTNQLSDERIDVEFDVVGLGKGTTVRPGKVVVETTVAAATAPEPAGLGVGVWIILAIIALIIIICVAYCVWQKKCKKYEAARTGEEDGDKAAGA